VAAQADPSDLRDPDLRAYYVARLAALDRERSSWWAKWRQQASLFTPERGAFLASANDSRRGARKDQQILDNTPLQAARVMASGMMAGISSPARPWFRLRLGGDESTSQDADVRAWLDEVQKRILVVFSRSNLYNCLHTLYGELGIFGTAALWVDEDEEDVVRGYVLTAGEYWLASSRRLAVDTLYRTAWWSVRTIVETFGRDAVSEAIRTAWDNGDLDTEHEIVHAIEPNPRALPALSGAEGGEDTRVPAGVAVRPWQGRLSRDLPYRSVWFERGVQGERTLLRLSGYEEFCCMAPRWDVVGSASYGNGPGAVALGDAQQLQKQQHVKLEIIQKLSKPPMIGPASMKTEPGTLIPGGITYMADPTAAAYRPAIVVDPSAVAAIAADIAETQARIKSAFYADLFLMMAESDRRQITAREIDERREEKMLMLGPVLERLHDELLDPLIVRVFNVMARNGLLPPPPQGLAVEGLQVEFISLLATAQKAASTGAIERFWQFGGQLGQLKPEALDRLDPDGTLEAYGDMLGVPSGVMVPMAEAGKARAARNQAAAEQAALARAAELADTARTASAVDVGGGANAVAAMLGRA
jgi:hypothetical protein